MKTTILQSLFKIALLLFGMVVGVGCDESFFEASCGYLFGNRFDCARAVI